MLTESIVELEPEEAELAKLFTNNWRYIKFAAANQFYVMANDHGLDFDRIRKALAHDYPRAADMPGAGFAAGPCLFKDTMQLAAFTDNSFVLGHSAMLVNEGLPLYLVTRMEKTHDLADLRVGILGMAFKGESDDIRSSLSYKLKRILEFRSREVFCTDPYVTVDDTLLPLDEVLERSDVLDHRRSAPGVRRRVTDKPVVDVWNLLGQTGRPYDPRSLRRHPRLQRGRGRRAPVLDRIFQAVESTLRGARRRRLRRGHHRARRRGLRRVRATASASWSTPTAAVRPTRSATASTTPATTSSSSPWPTASDDPRQIDPLARLVERGVVVAAASRYSAGGQQVGGPLLKGLISQRRRTLARRAGPRRHPRRDQQLQGLLHRLHPRGGDRQHAAASRSASS